MLDLGIPEEHVPLILAGARQLQEKSASEAIRTIYSEIFLALLSQSQSDGFKSLPERVVNLTMDRVLLELVPFKKAYITSLAISNQQLPMCQAMLQAINQKSIKHDQDHQQQQQKQQQQQSRPNHDVVSNSFN